MAALPAPAEAPKLDQLHTPAPGTIGRAALYVVQPSAPENAPQETSPESVPEENYETARHAGKLATHESTPLTFSDLSGKGRSYGEMCDIIWKDLRAKAEQGDFPTM